MIMTIMMNVFNLWCLPRRKSQCRKHRQRSPGWRDVMEMMMMTINDEDDEDKYDNDDDFPPLPGEEQGEEGSAAGTPVIINDKSS